MANYLTILVCIYALVRNHPGDTNGELSSEFDQILLVIMDEEKALTKCCVDCKWQDSCESLNAEGKVAEGTTPTREVRSQFSMELRNLK